MARTWFITGTSSGFGRLMAEALLARGDRVAATSRTPDALDDLAARHPDLLWRRDLDLTDPDAVRAAVGDAVRDLDGIDVVVSNAGYGLLGAAEELSDAQIRQQLDVNLLGSIHVIRAALPHLRARGGGRILQVSSEGGQIAYPGLSAYHASKWGIEGFVEAVAREVAGWGIHLTLVEPGPTATGFGDGMVRAPLMPAYSDTPAGAMRRTFKDPTAGGMGTFCDPAAVVRAMIAVAESTPAPLRLVLGSTAAGSLEAAWRSRLAALEAQRDLAEDADALA